MSSRHLIDPEIAPLLDAFPTFEFHNETLETIRGRVSVLTPNSRPAIDPQQRLVPGLNAEPDVPVLLFDPPHRVRGPAILQIHGGGMVMGTAAASNLANAALAIELGVLIVAVDYRLAPEHPFPAPQMDCLAVYDWMAANAEELRLDVNRIVLLGSSAGGGLAAALALMARDLGRTPPRAQILIYPMLDCRTGTAARPGLINTGEFIWTRESNCYGWEALRGDYACDDDRVGWFSPALAKNLSGLPPTFIATAAQDLFMAENLEYAQSLIAAGVPVELHLYPGACHGFDRVTTAKVTQQYKRDLKSALEKALASAGLPNGV